MANNHMIGRQKETALVNDIYTSPKADFIAVYGRRRIGKTFLMDKTFSEKYDFYMTGIYEGTKSEQLANFRHQLEKYSGKEIKQPKSWMDAFFCLKEYLETKKQKNRILS